MLAKGYTVLPATHTRTIPAYTPQPQSTTNYWLVLIVPTHGRMASLSWPGWLVIYWDRFPVLGVAHPSTNRARCTVTSLIEANPLPLRQTTNGPSIWYPRRIKKYHYHVQMNRNHKISDNQTRQNTLLLRWLKFLSVITTIKWPEWFSTDQCYQVGRNLHVR